MNYNLLPFSKYTLITKLTPENANQKVSEMLEQTRAKGRMYADRNTPIQYAGRIKGSEFKLERKPFSYNGMIPVIKGNIRRIDKTEIKISIRMQTALYIIVGILVGVNLFEISLYLIDLFSGHIVSSQSFLSPIGFLLFSYFMPLVIFKIQCNILKTNLKNLLEAEEINPKA